MGERLDDVEDDQRVGLFAIAASGDVEPEQAAFGDRLDQFGGDAARFFDLVGAGADRGLQLARRQDQGMLLVLREGVLGIGHERRVKRHA